MVEVQVQDRRERILDRAGALFASKGVKPTTVREIGDAAGILSGSLYHHFASKEAIIEAILARYADDLLVRHQDVVARTGDPEKQLAGLIRASFESLDAHRNACAIFQNDYNYLRTLPKFDEQQAKIRQVTQIWMKVLRDGAATGTFRADVEPRLFHHFAREAICNSVHWYPGDGRYQIDDVADACIRVLLGGYLSEPRPPS